MFSNPFFDISLDSFKDSNSGGTLKTLFIIPFLFFLSVGFLACTQQSDQNLKSQKTSQILIGHYGDFTGPLSSFGKSSKRGLLLAIEEQNSKGGIDGKAIELISIDTEGQMGSAQKAVKELAEKGVIAIIGDSLSQQALEGAKQAQRLKIPFISPGATSETFTEIGSYVFRVCFSDSFQAKAMAHFSTQTLGLKKIALIVDQNSGYSRGLAKYFKASLSAQKSVVAKAFYYRDRYEWKSLVSEIKAKAYDGIYIPGYYNDASQLAKYLFSEGVDLPLLGGDGWDSPQIYREFAGLNAYFSSHYHSHSSNAQNLLFSKGFEERWKKAPDSLAALSYDAGNILLEALEKQERSPTMPLQNAIAETSKHRGVTGTISLDKQRNAVKQAVILKVQAKGFSRLSEINPSSL